MKITLGIILIIIGVIGAIYLSVWWGIVQPIQTLCQLYDAHAITGTVIGHQAAKFVVRDILAALWAIVFIGVGAFLFHDDGFPFRD
jgi:hypothetical protein